MEPVDDVQVHAILLTGSFRLSFVGRFVLLRVSFVRVPRAADKSGQIRDIVMSRVSHVLSNMTRHTMSYIISPGLKVALAWVPTGLLQFTPYLFALAGLGKSEKLTESVSVYDHAVFLNWLQCYNNPSMNIIKDKTGRSIWFHVCISSHYQHIIQH